MMILHHFFLSDSIDRQWTAEMGEKLKKEREKSCFVIQTQFHFWCFLHTTEHRVVSSPPLAPLISIKGLAHFGTRSFDSITDIVLAHHHTIIVGFHFFRFAAFAFRCGGAEKVKRRAAAVIKRFSSFIFSFFYFIFCHPQLSRRLLCCVVNSHLFFSSPMWACLQHHRDDDN